MNSTSLLVLLCGALMLAAVAWLVLRGRDRQERPAGKGRKSVTGNSNRSANTYSEVVSRLPDPLRLSLSLLTELGWSRAQLDGMLAQISHGEPDGGALSTAFLGFRMVFEEVLTAVRESLTPAALAVQVGQVRTASDTATASLDLRWDLGQGRVWSYHGEAGLRRELGL